MKKNKLLFLAFLSCASPFALHAQNNAEAKASYHGTVSSVEYVPSMASRPGDLIPSDNSFREAKDKRSLPHQIIRGKDPQTKDDYFVRNRHEKEQSMSNRAADLVFDAYSSGSQPTDPSLAVGPNHVMVVFNTGFAIYDKSGNQLQGQTAPNPAIFPSGGCCDLTASYDNAADRWVLSFLGSGAQIAVSDGPNPLTAGWYVYTISAINDYQKLSIWSDGYYMTDNTSSSNKVWALERSAMLNGDANAQILGFNLQGIATFGFYSPQAFNVTDSNLPAAGGAPIVYMQDDAWSGVSTDHLKLWTIDVDWANASNSTISAPQQMNITPFIGVFDNGSFSNLTQPGGVNIDALQATIMNQAQFRKFATHNSAVFNFVVDVDASNGERAGVRWFELRQSGDNQPWTLYQEGTYTAADGKHAWNASLAMDDQGNIGMGYTAMSGPSSSNTNVRVSSYYTGRLSNDPLNTMTASEELIANGNSNIPGTRYGDYSKVDLDPSDGKSFWFINEYMNSGRKGVVGVFQIQPDAPDTEAPTTPTNLIANNITANGATLNWTASTDNIGVSQYNISIDDSLVGTSNTTTFNVTGLSALTSYTASVSAQDAADNVSGSASTAFTTLDNDTQAPTTPTNLAVSNITTEGATLSWTASTDNVGVSHYNILIDGTVVGTSASTTFDVTGLSELTPYTASVNAQDAADNVSGNASTTFTTLENTGEPGVIAAYYFESGRQGWSDPGSDCRRMNTIRSFEGLYSIRIRDNSSTSHSLSPTLDLTGNTEVTFEFFFYAYSMENGEDFFVEFYNGSGYQVVANYARGTHFDNDVFYVVTLTLDASTYNFNANNHFRMRCDASGNGDHIYFDAVTISGDNVIKASTPVAAVSAPSAEVDNTARLKAFTKAVADQVNVYPNPTRSELNIEIGNNNFDEIMVISSTGKIVHVGKVGVDKLTIDVSQFAPGMYFVRLVSDGMATTMRFVKN